MSNNIGINCINNQSIRKVHLWEEDRVWQDQYNFSSFLSKYLSIHVRQQDNNICVASVSRCHAADLEIL